MTPINSRNCLYCGNTVFEREIDGEFYVWCENCQIIEPETYNANENSIDDMRRPLSYKQKN